MKRMKQAAAGLVTVAIAAILISFPVANAQSSIKADTSLEGAWKTTVTPRICETGEPLPTMPPFEGLLTVNFGGTMAETSSGSAPATRGPGHGVWKRLPGWQVYSMSFIFQRFSPAGLIGTTVVHQEVQLDGSGDAFTSTGTVEIVANDGTVLGSICSTSTGTRFE